MSNFFHFYKSDNVCYVYNLKIRSLNHLFSDVKPSIKIP